MAWRLIKHRNNFSFAFTPWFLQPAHTDTHTAKQLMSTGKFVKMSHTRQHERFYFEGETKHERPVNMFLDERFCVYSS
jgi:hypothetical protein